ncbi:HNH endonuclease [Priestia aryabhattai]|uniref:HNH endonuclease n=1 Tax=Priestia aryabhattai TaxID=412384 RepID=UPI003CAF6DE3
MSTYERKESNRYYDKYQRNKESRAFYKSKEWLKCRELVMQRDNYLCQECLANQEITKADMVHHIEELVDAPDKALNMDNLISLCHSCHNKEHHERNNKSKSGNKSKVKAIKVRANREMI